MLIRRAAVTPSCCLKSHESQPTRGYRAELVAAALITTIQTLPAHLRRSLTWDQGMEMLHHFKIKLATNGLLRQYFPKGTDLKQHSQEHLAAVAAELNGRPRKTLGWATPAEAMTRLMSNPEQPVVATTD
jgi:IS30 family transposase